MVLQIKTEGRDKFPMNIPQIYVNFMKDERFPGTVVNLGGLTFTNAPFMHTTLPI